MRLPLCTLGLVLALCAPASAATTSVTVVGGELRVIGSGSDVSALTIAASGADLTVTDLGPGVTVQASAPCSAAGDVGTCPAAGITNLLVQAVNGNDVVTVDAALALPARLEGGAGDDTLTGGAAADTLLAGDGDDTLRGRGGADVLTGERGTDTATYDERTTGVMVTLEGGANDGAPGEGDDARAERAVGGSGPDTLTTPAGDAFTGLGGDLIGGAGADTLTGGAGDDIIDGGPDGDTLRAGAGNDTLTGNTGNDTIFGEDGNDRVDEGAATAGTDAIDGGAGTDSVEYDARTAAVTLVLDGVANDGQAGENDNLSALETLEGGNGADTITGSGANETLIGNTGIDSLRGLGGDDRLEGNLGADLMDGGDGIDTAVYIDAATHTIRLDGLANDGATNENDNALTENVRGGQGVDTIYGNDGPNVISGGFGADVLEGGAGDDALLGDEGNDTLRGGEGDDVLDGMAGNDVMDGGPGRDLADYRDRFQVLTITLDGAANDGQSGETDNVQTDDVIAGAGNDTVTGDAGPNHLNGGSGANALHGSSGDDTLTAGGGPDLFDGGPGVDGTSYESRSGPVTVTLDGAANDGLPAEGDNVQAERVTGSPYADTLTGGAGDDRLEGGDGSDTLAGAAGDDLLIGGPGGDRLESGTGADQLRALDGEADVLTCDMVTGKDVEADATDDAVSCGGAATGGGGTVLPAINLSPPLTPLPDPPGANVVRRRSPSAASRLLAALGDRPRSGARLRLARGDALDLGAFRCPSGSCTVAATVKAGRKTLGKGRWTVTATRTRVLDVALPARLRRRTSVVATLSIRGLGTTVTVRTPLVLTGRAR